MSDHEPRDTLVAEALRTMPVPDHLPGFWTELDARLAVIDRERRGDGERERAPDREAVAPPEPLPLRLATGELPLVRPLPLESRRERVARRRGRVMAVAAVALGAVLVTGILLARPDGGGEGSPIATASTAVPFAAPDVIDPNASGAPTTTSILGPPRSDDPALRAVGSFLRALGNGDTYAAWVLMSRESRASWESYEAFSEATGLFEGYGAWGGLELAESVITMPVLTPVHSGAQVVTLSGVVAPEGNAEYRVQPFAVVYEDDMWKIDLVGSLESASSGPAIELRRPQRDFTGVGGGIAVDDLIEFTVPPGTDADFITVQIDDQDPVDPSLLDLSDMLVSLRPGLAYGTHVLTIAVVLEDGSFYTTAVQFVVE